MMNDAFLNRVPERHSIFMDMGFPDSDAGHHMAKHKFSVEFRMGNENFRYGAHRINSGTRGGA